MTTVNSLSGGKTSSYLAMHYPADLNIFALVCADDHNAGKHIDKTVKKMVNDRLARYCPHYPEFVATTEDPQTLRVILDLEQLLGHEIIWLRGLSWEWVLRAKRAIPNTQQRFCTTLLKILPIFEHLYTYYDLPVEMRIGYRYDEAERRLAFTDHFKWATHCEFRENSQSWIHRWQDIYWRTGAFPLIEDKVFHHTIQAYWKDKAITFPPDSNCQNCFHKPPQQLRKNFDTNGPIMYWAAIQEQLYQHTFRADYSLLDIQKHALQTEFMFGTGSGCQAGFCTD